MSSYPMIEQNGMCASISTRREPTKRWTAWVHVERNCDYARLKAHAAPALRVPNDYPSEEMAVKAAYEFARGRMTEDLHALH